MIKCKLTQLLAYSLIFVQSLKSLNASHGTMERKCRSVRFGLGQADCCVSPVRLLRDPNINSHIHRPLLTYSLASSDQLYLLVKTLLCL